MTTAINQSQSDVNLQPIPVKGVDSHAEWRADHPEEVWAALQSMGKVLESPIDVVKIINTMTPSEITLTPIAAYEMYYRIQKIVAETIGSFDLINLPTVERISDMALDRFNAALPDIYANIMPTGDALKYNIACRRFNANRADALSIMPQIIDAILVNSNFKIHVEVEIQRTLDILKDDIKAAKQQDRANKINFALEYAKEESTKELQRSFIDSRRMTAVELKLMNLLNFSVKQIEEFLNPIDKKLVDWLEYIIKEVNANLNGWVNTIRLDNFHYHELAFNPSAKSWPAQTEAINFCVDRSRLFSEKVDFNDYEKLRAMYERLITSSAFLREIKVRTASRLIELNRLLPSNDAGYHEMYDFDIKAALADMNALTKYGTTASMILPVQSKPSITSPKMLGGQPGFSVLDHAGLLLAAGSAVLLCFCLVKRSSLFRMGSSLSDAGKAGLTLMSRKISSGIPYYRIDTQKNSDDEESRLISRRHTNSL
jgi:hypothetical protein